MNKYQRVLDFLLWQKNIWERVRRCNEHCFFFFFLLFERVITMKSICIHIMMSSIFLERSLRVLLTEKLLIKHRTWIIHGICNEHCLFLFERAFTIKHQISSWDFSFYSICWKDQCMSVWHSRQWKRWGVIIYCKRNETQIKSYSIDFYRDKDK